MINEDDWDRRFAEVSNQVHELYRLKRGDYLADRPPAESLLASLDVGVAPWRANLVRLGDKFRLLATAAKKGTYSRHDESVRETLLDVCAYATLTVLLLDMEDAGDAAI
jgi:hypothetical protein